MLSSISLMFFVSFVAIASAQTEMPHDGHNMNGHFHVVKVDVYYESLCTDSIKFFTSQLYPSLQDSLANHINLTLIPYGKSTHTMKLNEITFNCHHGPSECEGNKIQACALQLIDGGKNTEKLGFNRKTVGFINCLMDKVLPKSTPVKFPTNECATINNVTNLSDIDNCTKHTAGTNYLANLGGKTNSLTPALTSVPTIIFNNEFKKEDNDEANKNFVKVVCKYIVHDKPAVCTENGANFMQISLTLIPIVAYTIFRSL